MSTDSFGKLRFQAAAFVMVVLLAGELAQAVEPEAVTAVPAAEPAPVASVVPVKAIYVSENQPVQIVDNQGRLIQVIYLKRAK